MQTLNKKLLSFHLNCQDEYNTLLNDYNLLFYGYGNKETIISQLFPSSLVFNMRFSSIDSIIEECEQNLTNNKKFSTLKDLDSFLTKKCKKMIFALLNFDFNCTEFENLKSIKIIGTIEDIEFTFTQNDLLKYNFILRDLTTFEDYTDDIIHFDVIDDKIQNAKMVIGNLSPKPKIVFTELLKLGNCSVNTLFDGVKSLLFLSKIQTLLDLLREFIDHKIIKLVGNNISINLTESEKKSVLEILENEKNVLLK